eukprot:snap_masked-scaffold_20-processed-gene-1.3-mRNA-1 protein AED:1.00 eAED:1.00 QI:0/-1/0/0/-1/1/1/0/725
MKQKEDIKIDKLDLSGQYLSNGNVLREISLRNSESIHFVDLSRTNVNYQYLNILLPKLFAVNTLILSKCEQLTDSAFFLITMMTRVSLSFLDISHCTLLKGVCLTLVCSFHRNLVGINVSGTNMRPDCYIILKSLSHLKYLNLSETSVNSRLYIELPKLCHLRMLDVSRCNVLDSDLTHLGMITNLRCIKLNFCHKVTNEGVNRFRQGNSKLLKVIELQNTRISEVSLVRLMQEFLYIQKIAFRGCPSVTQHEINNILVSFSLFVFEECEVCILRKPKWRHLQLSRIRKKTENKAARSITEFIRKIQRKRSKAHFLARNEIHVAAITLQTCVKIIKAKKTRKLLRKARLEELSATFIKSFIQKQKQLKYINQYLKDFIWVRKAIVIEKVFRGYICRKELANNETWQIEVLRKKLMLGKAISILQSRNNNRIQKRINRGEKKMEKSLALVQDHAVTVLSACVRRCNAQKRYIKLRYSIFCQKVVWGKKAVTIQHWFKLELSIQYLYNRAREIRIRMKLELKSLILLQCNWRCFQARCDLNLRIAKRQLEVRNALIIQKVWRGSRVFPWKVIRLSLIRSFSHKKRVREEEEARHRVLQRRNLGLVVNIDDCDEAEDENDDWQEFHHDGQVVYWSPSRQIKSFKTMRKHELEESTIGKRILYQDRAWTVIRFKSKTKLWLVRGDQGKAWIDLMRNRLEISIYMEEYSLWAQLEQYFSLIQQRMKKLIC